jgi:hypothetical protein
MNNNNWIITFYDLSLNKIGTAESVGSSNPNALLNLVRSINTLGHQVQILYVRRLEQRELW